MLSVVYSPRRHGVPSEASAPAEGRRAGSIEETYACQRRRAVFVLAFDASQVVRETSLGGTIFLSSLLLLLCAKRLLTWDSLQENLPIVSQINFLLAYVASNISAKNPIYSE